MYGLVGSRITVAGHSGKSRGLQRVRETIIFAVPTPLGALQNIMFVIPTPPGVLQNISSAGPPRPIFFFEL